MQLVRDLADVLGQLLYMHLKIAELLVDLFYRRGVFHQQAADIEGEQCKLLAQLVMQLAGDSFPLLVLRID